MLIPSGRRHRGGRTACDGAGVRRFVPLLFYQSGEQAMKGGAIAWLLVMAWPVLGTGGTTGPGEGVVARAAVPNPWFPQGEVRLVEQDGAVVVQTVLRTRFEQRVMRYILEKEDVHWPNHPDAEAYAQALRRAVEEYDRRRAGTEDDLGLVIEFSEDADATEVRFRFAPVRRTEAGLSIDPAPTWIRLDLSHGYVRKNQELILEDAFKDRADEVLDSLHAMRADRPSRPW